MQLELGPQPDRVGVAEHGQETVESLQRNAQVAKRQNEEAAGGECWIGTPDVVGSLRYALENVTILMWLLGGVEEDPPHGSRLRMMLEKTTDTTVRGVVYEVGTDAGVAEMEHAWATNEIPFSLLHADRADASAWIRATRAAIDDVLAVRR